MSALQNRRSFLKQTGIGTAAAVAASNFALNTPVHAAGSDEIRIALVGCGGRGSGAVRDRAQVGDHYKITAVADAFEDSAKRGADSLRKDAAKEENPLAGKVDIADDSVFHGLDAYKKAMDCLKPGDQVILATPPGFRPFHYRYAVEKGLHVFMEKPVCIDAAGFRHVMETNKTAEEKNLKICVGFQVRLDVAPWIEQIHAGKIGTLLSTRIYYNAGRIWCRPREEGEEELHFQIRNWYHFPYLCGENIAEQHCHTIDLANQIHSKGDRMGHPVEANTMGGRTYKAAPEELLRQAPPFSDRKEWDKWYQEHKSAFPRHGQAWDHFFTEYTYADGSKVYSQCRHINNCWTHTLSEYVQGTSGSGTYLGYNPGKGKLVDSEGHEIWTKTGKLPKVSNQWEHDLHVKAIREDLPMHQGYAGAMSCMMAVLGREAGYSGKVIKWDDLVEKGRDYFPNGEITSWDSPAPVQPDADGFYENSVPVPGVYNPFAG
ncbi:MAG: Gfo/Idh/MocA family oxidoreductase [Planctomycetaceae bacterium]|jgi:predicted dehydrogenase|nr:Gfo/Idh/MocA family oxidoreductase [Planctomycetaceae bacterium]